MGNFPTEACSKQPAAFSGRPCVSEPSRIDRDIASNALARPASIGTCRNTVALTPPAYLLLLQIAFAEYIQRHGTFVNRYRYGLSARGPRRDEDRIPGTKIRQSDRFSALFKIMGLSVDAHQLRYLSGTL